MSEYSERLKHPMWQRKRLEILERDGFECTQCGAKDQQLHVHHLFYRKGREPWDYPSLSLQTLCHECHDGIHEEARECDQLLVQEFRSFGINEMDLYGFCSALFQARSDNDRLMSEKEWALLGNVLNAAIRMIQAGVDIEALSDDLLKQASKAEQDAA